MANKKQKLFTLFTLAVLLCGLFLSLMPISAVAYADEIAYSDVLTDLQKAENFNASIYPSIDKDYSLEVIQIAESTDDELLVYVYQPSADKGNIKATTLSMSVVDGPDINPTLFDLEFLNSNGVFYKYRVKNFTVPQDDTRIYSIVSIFRSFIAGVDEEAGNDNTISEVPFKVAKEYTFYSGQDSYQMEVLDVVEIVDKFVGYVLTSTDSVLLETDSIWNVKQSWYVQKYSYFVAFSTNKDIDKLLEAQIFYVKQKAGHYKEYSLTPRDDVYFGPHENHSTTITSDQRLAYTTGALWWKEDKVVNRIQTVDEFVSSVEYSSSICSGAILDVSMGSTLTDEGKEALKNKQWVVRFADIENWHYFDMNGIFDIVSGVSVGDVSILRLKFETGGKIYNLGVVDNKQTGSDKPVNEDAYEIVFKLLELLKDSNIGDILAIILIVLLVVVVLAVSAPILPYVFKALLSITLWFGKVLGRHTKRTMKSVRNVAEGTRDLIKKTNAQREREEKQHQKKLKKELRKKHSKRG